MSLKFVHAQAEDTIWFWAWRSYDLEVTQTEDQRGDLIAFTPDGVVNTLLEDVFPIVLRRVSDNQSFVGGKIADTYSLYYLTSTQAVKVTELFDQSYMDSLRSYDVYYAGSKYFMPDIIPAGKGRYLIADTKRDQYAIFDAIEQQTTNVKLRPWCKDECVRVSEDGRYIRYRVSPSDVMADSSTASRGENTLPYQIFEYDTLTQTERLVYEQPILDRGVRYNTPPYGDCTPDRYGDRWYCELYFDDDQTPSGVANEKRIVSINGDAEEVPFEWKLKIFDDKWYFLDLDRNAYNVGQCDDCTITVHPDRLENPPFEFLAPQRAGTSFENGYSAFGNNIQLLSEEYIGLGLQSSTAYAVSRAGEVTELGVRHCCTDPTSFDFYDAKSGFLVSYNLTTKQTQIWNTRPLTLIGSLPGSVTPGVRSTFRDYSLVVYKEGHAFSPHGAYSYLDQRFYEFEYPLNLGYVAYMDAIPGGTLLASYGDEYWLDKMYRLSGDAIYRWTAEDGASLLVQDAIPIPNY
ncbi:MAG: hypothetical protein LCI00_15200 [Chloroflexi bacterium]|nr:hypothetical protein [Chloroflexota bacterium]MCC6892645.1 hypothetical protein [Anaerolineae bacterium]